MEGKSQSLDIGTGDRTFAITKMAGITTQFNKDFILAYVYEENFCRGLVLKLI